MSDEKTVYVGNGIGFPALLFIVFLVLKLCGVITWSWLWVFSPLLIPFAIVLAVLAIWLIVALVLGVIALIFRR